MTYSRHIIVIGSFSTIFKDANCQHVTLLDMYNSDGTLPDKSAIEDRLNYRLKNTQQFVLSYSIATQANSNVSPWGAFRSVSIASDINAYGTPIGVAVKAPANNNPAHACLVGTNLNAYSATAGTVVVYVTYNAFSYMMAPWT